ncbi:uncharacterized protein LOC129790752 [Lutzomyia longipalpis]|uniref:uncharacterized protein LOC129790752 n=1 Tax=Lutzomyia longipalpis TaxID=7200 RepID=UPI00248457A2|nr:uncharacterized protein LOC129790752 [Lutzomyia longipalpis]
MTATGAEVIQFLRWMGRKVIKRRLEKCIYKGCPYQRTRDSDFYKSTWEASCPSEGYHRRHHRHSQFFSIKKMTFFKLPSSKIFVLQHASWDSHADKPKINLPYQN